MIFLDHFSVGLSAFFLWVCKSSLQILDIMKMNSLLDIVLLILSQCDMPFHYLMVSFSEQRQQSNLLICFIFIALFYLRNIEYFKSKKVSSIILLKITSISTFKFITCLINFLLYKYLMLDHSFKKNCPCCNPCYSYHKQEIVYDSSI